MSPPWKACICAALVRFHEGLFPYQHDRWWVGALSSLCLYAVFLIIFHGLEKTK